MTDPNPRPLFIGLAGTTLTPANRQLLEDIQPGGVILFARNIDSRPQLRRLIADIKETCQHPPTIGIDHENRRVNRLRYLVGELPSLADVVAQHRAHVFGRELGRQLRDLGIDLDFAPVLDLELFDEETDNALRERCWGRDPATVVAHAGEFIEGLQAEGVAACPKHFPGLGGARCDAHDALPIITRRAAELWEEDARPFCELLGRCQAVMVGHGCYPALDPDHPASLSRPIITGWLRERLGFRGRVLTDDLEMGAIGKVATAAVAARAAGADQLLVCHTPETIREAHAVLAG